ncbi:MAG TPA: hypothetical protein VNI60_04505 [Pyrinomonadaceae bacterium]|nr:hypothetical protein [Pyrinomonadaceae bacterium]
MTKENSSIKRKLVHAGGWQIAKRVAKSVPYVGTVMAIGLVGYDIKRKGVVKGVLNAGLDAIPFVGMGKNVVEFFTGDLLPDKDASSQRKGVKNEIRNF